MIVHAPLTFSFPSLHRVTLVSKIAQNTPVNPAENLSCFLIQNSIIYISMYSVLYTPVTVDLQQEGRQN
jgi:hypothetical protein